MPDRIGRVWIAAPSNYRATIARVGPVRTALSSRLSDHNRSGPPGLDRTVVPLISGRDCSRPPGLDRTVIPLIGQKLLASTRLDRIRHPLIGPPLLASARLRPHRRPYQSGHNWSRRPGLDRTVVPLIGPQSRTSGRFGSTVVPLIGPQSRASTGLDPPSSRSSGRNRARRPGLDPPSSRSSATIARVDGVGSASTTRTARARAPEAARRSRAAPGAGRVLLGRCCAGARAVPLFALASSIEVARWPPRKMTPGALGGGAVRVKPAAHGVPKLNMAPGSDSRRHPRTRCGDLRCSRSATA